MIKLDLDRAMRIPKKYARARFEDFRGLDRAINTARKAIKAGKSISFQGPPGTGKTTLMVCLGHEMTGHPIEDFGRILEGEEALRALHKPRPLFWTWPNLLAELYDSFNGGSRPTESIIRECFTTPLLMLDDFGKGKITDFVKSTLYRLIEARHSEELPIIVTTNLSMNEIADQVDPAIASRLFGMGEVINLGEVDWRLKR